MTVSSFEPAFRKLPPKVHAHLKEQIMRLADGPRSGNQLTGPYRSLWSLHTRFCGTVYRVLYTVSDRQREVTMIYTASRENYYREIARLRLKAT